MLLYPPRNDVKDNNVGTRSERWTKWLWKQVTCSDNIKIQRNLRTKIAERQKPYTVSLIYIMCISISNWLAGVSSCFQSVTSWGNSRYTPCATTLIQGVLEHYVALNRQRCQNARVVYFRLTFDIPYCRLPALPICRETRQTVPESQKTKLDLVVHERRSCTQSFTFTVDHGWSRPKSYII